MENTQTSIQTKVVIFCGGEGARMRDYTEIPKPLVEIGDKPILIHLMEIFSSFASANDS